MSDEVTMDALLWRVEALEEWKREVSRWFDSRASRPKQPNNLIGSISLEREYSKLFCSVGPEVHEKAAHHFFNNMDHDQRVSVLLSCGVITSYISNDPVYYGDALDTIMADRDKAAQVFIRIVEAAKTKPDKENVLTVDRDKLKRRALSAMRLLNPKERQEVMEKLGETMGWEGICGIKGLR